MRPSYDIILCDLDAGKKFKPWEKCLPESPFIEMTYHIRGYLTFRLNELDSAMSMA
jgi:hypothetical protein